MIQLGLWNLVSCQIGFKNKVLCKVYPQPCAFIISISSDLCVYVLGAGHMTGDWRLKWKNNLLAVMWGPWWNWWSGQREAHALHSWVRNEWICLFQTQSPSPICLLGTLNPTLLGPLGFNLSPHLHMEAGTAELQAKSAHKSSHARTTKQSANATEETIKEWTYEEWEHIQCNDILMT